MWVDYRVRESEVQEVSYKLYWLFLQSCILCILLYPRIIGRCNDALLKEVVDSDRILFKYIEKQGWFDE